VDGVLGGWSIAGIAILRSGTPFNVTLGSDANDDGATDDRPALVGRVVKSASVIVAFLVAAVLLRKK
jgi:hypothetical protein